MYNHGIIGLQMMSYGDMLDIEAGIREKVPVSQRFFMEVNKHGKENKI